MYAFLLFLLLSSCSNCGMCQLDTQCITFQHNSIQFNPRCMVKRELPAIGQTDCNCNLLNFKLKYVCTFIHSLNISHKCKYCLFLLYFSFIYIHALSKSQLPVTLFAARYLLTRIIFSFVNLFVWTTNRQ